jgi:hypothetical protein
VLSDKSIKEFSTENFLNFQESCSVESIIKGFADRFSNEFNCIYGSFSEHVINFLLDLET